MPHMNGRAVSMAADQPIRIGSADSGLIADCAGLFLAQSETEFHAAGDSTLIAL